MSLSMPRSRSAFVVLFSLLVLLSGPIAMTAPPALQSLRTTTSVIVPSWGGVGSSDILWRYSGSTWSNIIPPAPGKYWRWIAADPFDPQRWLLLGNSDGSDEFAYGTNGVRMRDGTTPPLWSTRDAGATWTPIILPARGAYFATRLNQVEWSTSTPGVWLIAGYVVGSTWNAASLWRGSLTDTTEFLLLEELQNSRWLELKYAVSGLSNDAVIAEWDSPGGGTAGRLGYQRAGSADLTQSGTGYLFRGFQIDRLPGTSPVVVGVDQAFAGNGAELWATDDYRTSAPLRRLVLDEGTWITAARDGVYIGGRSNGVIHVTNPVTAPIPQLVTGNGDWIGFVRADRQTQTGISALQGGTEPRRVYLRPADAAVWEVIALPSAATAVANRLEVIVTAQAITPTPIPAPTQTPTPIPAPPVQTPPEFTTSYYEGTTNLKIHRQQGCRARDLGEQGIVVLMYGSPRQLGTAKNPVYGAGLFRPRGDPLPQPVNLNDIKAAVRAFADGYYSYRSCRQFGITIPDPTPANLVIAVGTSNSPFLQTGSNGRVYRVLNPALTKDHGAAWARMLIELRRDLIRQGYRGVKIAGAYDAEPDFWSVDRDGDQIEEPVPGPTFDWARGYDAVPDRPEYYNFGSMDGGLRDSSWLSQPSNQRFEQIFELSSGIGAARPLPQIYNWAYAKEWYQLRRYAKVKKQRELLIAGTMTQAQSSNVDVNKRKAWQEFLLSLPNSPRDFENFPPRQGWQSLYDTLNRTLTANQRLSANLILSDSFLVAPGTSLSIARMSGCAPRSVTYRATALIPRGTCIPAGTIFPIDSTFPATVAVPPALATGFGTQVRQERLPWSTDIAFGRWK